MPALPDAVAAHYREQQRLQALTVSASRRAWARMARDFDASWRAVAPQLVVLLSAAQLSAAQSGAQYVPAALEETGQPNAASGAVRARGLVGVASDGRPLESLLYGAVVTAKSGAAAAGAAAGLAAGGRWLDMVVQSVVADAARSAAGVAIAARPQVGWVRMLNPPACSRCAILAGKFFRWNQGFQRHPRCDCRHIPSTESMAGDFTTDPGAYFRSLPATEQDRAFTKAGAQAIRDGADVGQVVNVRRGMTAAGTTTVGARTGARLMPERIYAQASDRGEALRLLRANGYLT